MSLDYPSTPDAGIGHNSSDPVAKREALREQIAAFLRGLDIWSERKTVTTETAPRMRDFIAGLKKLAKEADEARKAEKKPHDDAAKAVQAAWAPVLDRIDGALKVAEPMLAAYLREEQRKAHEAEMAARRAAEEAERAKAAALADAQAATRESERIEAQARAAELEAARQEAAARAAAVSAPVRVESATGLAKRAGLRTVRKARVTDIARALFHYRAHPEIGALIERLANADIRAAKGAEIAIPGIEIVETQELAG